MTTKLPELPKVLRLVSSLRDSAKISTVPKWARDEMLAAADAIDELRQSLASKPQPVSPEVVEALSDWGLQAIDDACEVLEMAGLHGLQEYQALKAKHKTLRERAGQ